jgi:hypothetical protein
LRPCKPFWYHVSARKQLPPRKEQSLDAEILPDSFVFVKRKMVQSI